jgi:hypothetical protein
MVIGTAYSASADLSATVEIESCCINGTPIHDSSIRVVRAGLRDILKFRGMP